MTKLLCPLMLQDGKVTCAALTCPTRIAWGSLLGTALVDTCTASLTSRVMCGQMISVKGPFFTSFVVGKMYRILQSSAKIASAGLDYGCSGHDAKLL